MSGPRPPIDVIFDVFKEDVPATITLPGGSPVSADIVWLSSESTKEPAGGGSVLDTMPRLAVRRDQVPELVVGSRIRVATMGGATVKTWTVRRIDGAVDPERIIVAVM